MHSITRVYPNRSARSKQSVISHSVGLSIRFINPALYCIDPGLDCGSYELDSVVTPWQFSPLSFQTDEIRKKRGNVTSYLEDGSLMEYAYIPESNTLERNDDKIPQEMFMGYLSSHPISASIFQKYTRRTNTGDVPAKVLVR